MTAGPEGLERLLALEDIRMLRSRYCQYIDHKEFDSLADVFTEDFVLDTSPTAKVLGGNHPGPVSGRDAVIANLKKGFTPMKKSVHLTTIPIIEFHDAEHATGIWRQETFVKEGRPDFPGTGIAYATATDTYRKDDGEWRMTSVTVELDVVI